MMFFKMQGLGNDYVYIDCTNKKEPIDVKNLSKKLSDRHFGIGSDGLILLCKSNIADLIKMEPKHKCVEMESDV